METIEVRTDVHVESRDVFAFLLDFTEYAEFSPYVRQVTIETPGEQVTGINAGAGTRYGIQLGWWRLSYRVRAEVTEVNPPERIDWQVVSDLDAHGRWEIQPAQPGSREETTIRFLAHYDPDGGEPDDFDRPTAISFDWVLNAVIPIIETEGRRVVERIVTELEGEKRPVDLVVEKHTGTVDYTLD